MYSPKIREDLIPKLYLLSKHFKIPMTRLVNQSLQHVINELKNKGVHIDSIEGKGRTK